VENIRPIYRLLEGLGMRTTKTVWPVWCPEGGSPDFSSSETLEDPEYRAFVIDLQRRGFETASHGATMESRPRARPLAAMERFREDFCASPRLQANHGYNRGNLYWGVDRLDDPLLRAVYRRTERAAWPDTTRDTFPGPPTGGEISRNSAWSMPGT
jgi:hypothetical protein